MRTLPLILLCACASTRPSVAPTAEDTDLVSASDTDARSTDTAIDDTASAVDTAPTFWTTAQAEDTLRAATPGLLFLSESEWTPDVVVLRDGGMAWGRLDVRELLAPVYVAQPEHLALADRFVQTVELASLFDRLTVPQPWWSEWEQGQQPGWVTVRDVFEHRLRAAQVVRLGELDLGYGQVGGAVDVYVIGASADGDLVMVHVVSVET
jgi:hypothetical protein